MRALYKMKRKVFKIQTKKNPYLDIFNTVSGNEGQ